MLYRAMIGALVLASCLTANVHCMAAGATAIGQPADISRDGVAIYTYVNADSAEAAKQSALKGCQGLPNASETSKALCKVILTFENQCVAQAMDPQSGTPGFGWALAQDSGQAREGALTNCRNTAGPTRQKECVIGPRDVWCDGSAK